jgi:hypothetical protein
VSGPVDWLPEVAMAPNHAPEAEQEVAFVEDQVSVEDPPLATDVGFAASDTVGAGVTVTVADALAVPPDPVQARMNVLVVVSAPVDWPVLLESALLPDHALEARQEAALVDDQVSVEDPPLATDVGFAASDTVGAGGGGGIPDTVTPAEAFAIPPEPVQVREKVLLVVSGAVDWLPEVALAPDHAPEAEQEVASVEDQVSIEDPLLATDAGFTASDTVGGDAAPPEPAYVTGPPAPPQAAIARASRGTSSKVLIRKTGIPIP